MRSRADAVKSVETKGFNPGLIVLLITGGLLSVFLVGNYVLYIYAQKTLPPKKKKPVSKKKIKRERMKQGISAPGDGSAIRIIHSGGFKGRSLRRATPTHSFIMLLLQGREGSLHYHAIRNSVDDWHDSAFNHAKNLHSVATNLTV
ncbi:DNA-binding protein S1FA2-like protein [Drosera capensis]